MEAARIGVVNVDLFGAFRDPSELIAGMSVKLEKISVRRDESLDLIVEKLKALDVIIAGSTPTYDRRLFSRLPRLKAVVRWGVGYDNVVLEDATNEGVIASRLPDYILKDLKRF